MTKTYPESIILSHPNRIISGHVPLNRSKSISNRVLIIRALCNNKFPIHHLSDSDDTRTLESILGSTEQQEFDCHHAGTTYRFLCSYLAIQPGEQILTGSERMKERPIGPLVDALRSLGADISYLEKEGFPPLLIKQNKKEWAQEVELPAGISSQYISSLMMIAPVLKNGLKIRLIGELVSRPYLEMTANIMEYFGVKVQWTENEIRIDHQKYIGKEFTVEADWSAASYYYSIVALAEKAHLKVDGLYQNSLQGDSAIAEISKKFGIETIYSDKGIEIVKNAETSPFIEYDFINQPDIAQTVFVMVGGLGMHGLYSGLKTLYIKETDRIHAMKTELAKFQVYLNKVPPRFAKNSNEEKFMQEGKAVYSPVARIQTYRDHRMAMAMAPLGLLFPIRIDKPGVVSKSYPAFWDHLQNLGFEVIEEID